MYASRPTSRTNAKLLLNYGFALAGNPFDAVQLPVWPIVLPDAPMRAQFELAHPLEAAAHFPELAALLRRHVLVAEPLLTAPDPLNAVLPSLDVLALFRALHITPDDFASDVLATVAALKDVCA